MTKHFLLFFMIFNFSSCAILSQRFNIYSGGSLKIDGISASVKKTGAKVKKEFCNHIPFIIPLSNKNQFDVMDDLITESKGFNALANGKVESTFLNIPIIYMRICHKVEGIPILLSE